MKLLIVDDEYYIVKSIAESINWEDFGINQVFRAYSTDQARKVFLEQDGIDILMTDIEMPQENGLSLVRWAADRGFHPISLILTGHQRFDYAREAISLHIFSYLLKPLDPDELRSQIQKAVLAVRKQEFPKNAVQEQLPASPRPAEDSSDPVVKIKAYVRRHLADADLNRQMIADEVHMNPDYMSHIFSTRTGASLSSYIMDMRISEAKRLLTSGNLPLSQISEMTGFSNTSYFHRQFKKNCGMTPQSYREMNTQK